MLERRKRIVDCAHMILGEGGTQALTIDRLSREADVAPRTLYRLFGDKDGVIHATVTDRLREVRSYLAGKNRDYDLDTVLAELDWMVDEMRRDSLYAHVVIGFYFAQDPREASIRELTSVAYNRFRNWLDREIAAGHVEARLDLDRVAQEHLANEFAVYHRWTVHEDDDRSRLELRCCFLKSAIVVLTGPVRDDYVALLAEHQRRLGLTELAAGASSNRAERDAGEAFADGY